MSKNSRQNSSSLEDASSHIGSMLPRLKGQTAPRLMGGLSEALGVVLHAKREDLSPIGSFKVRGTLVAMRDIPKGTVVYTASAGNHAQGVAFCSKLYGLRVVIFVPIGTDPYKVDAIRKFGGSNVDLVIQGKDYDQAYDLAVVECERKGGVFVPAFDHAAVIAGQATSAIEFFEQNPDLDVVYVPIGGGGLLAGYLLARQTLGVKTKIVGVEPLAAACALEAMKAGEPVKIETSETLAEGAKVAKVGAIPFDIMRKHEFELIQVSEQEIVDGLNMLYSNQQILLEGAGVLGLAGAIQQKDLIQGKKVGIVFSGGNISIKRLGLAYQRSSLK